MNRSVEQIKLGVFCEALRREYRQALDNAEAARKDRNFRTASWWNGRADGLNRAILLMETVRTA